MQLRNDGKYLLKSFYYNKSVTTTGKIKVICCDIGFSILKQIFEVHIKKKKLFKFKN